MSCACKIVLIADNFQTKNGLPLRFLCKYSIL